MPVLPAAFRCNPAQLDFARSAGVDLPSVTETGRRGRSIRSNRDQDGWAEHLNDACQRSFGPITRPGAGTGYRASRAGAS